MLTPPLVVVARIRAPPAPIVVVSSRPIFPCTVIGKSTLIRPLTVDVRATPNVSGIVMLMPPLWVSISRPWPSQ